MCFPSDAHKPSLPRSWCTAVALRDVSVTGVAESPVSKALADCRPPATIVPSEVRAMARTHLALGVLVSLLVSGCAASAEVAPHMTVEPPSHQDASPSARAAQSPIAAPEQPHPRRLRQHQLRNPPGTRRLRCLASAKDSRWLSATARSSSSATTATLGRRLQEWRRARQRTGRLNDPATDTWVAAESLNKPRRWATTVALPNGSAMVLGGVNSDAEPFSSTKIISPATRTWTSGPLMTVARAYPDSVTLGDGRVLVVGSGALPSDRTNPRPAIPARSTTRQPASGQARPDCRGRERRSAPCSASA